MNHKKNLSFLLASLLALSANVTAVEEEVTLQRTQTASSSNGSYVGEVSLDGIKYDVEITAPYDAKGVKSRSIRWVLKSQENKSNKYDPKHPTLKSILYDVNGKSWRAELVDAEGSEGAQELKMKIIEAETGLSLEDVRLIEECHFNGGGYTHDAQGKIIPITRECTAQEKEIAQKKSQSKDVMPKISDAHELTLKYHTGSDTIYRYYATGVQIPLNLTKLEGVDGVGHAVGTFPKLKPGLQIAIARSAPGALYDRLYFDRNSNGKFDDETALHLDIQERRGKWWSRLSDQSLKVMHQMQGEKMEVEGHTDLSCWMVADGRDAVPEVIRFTNKTCSVSEVTLAGIPYQVVLQDFNHDGAMTQEGGDSWYLRGKYRNYHLEGYTGIGDYLYGVKGKAWKIEVVDGIGLKANIFEVEPHMSKREKMIMRGLVRVKNPDVDAPMAKEPIVFETDLAKALEKAKERKTSCFVKFETTWCGPCQVLNKTVFTKQEVAEAAKGVVCVKIDGDKYPDLVKKYKVTGYPTMKMLDSEGNETETFKGARNIKGISGFLRSGKK